MNISVQKLLEKIEDELAAVREENLREKVYSIKVLCELILDEKQIETVSQVMTKGYVQQPMMPVSLPKKSANDGANGDSLFDF